MIKNAFYALFLLCSIARMSTASNYMVNSVVFEHKDTVVFNMTTSPVPGDSIQAVLTWGNDFVPDYTTMQTIYSRLVKALMDFTPISAEIDTTNGANLIHWAQTTPLAPDLIITEVKVVETSWIVGSVIHFQATVKNSGNASTPASRSRVQFSVNGVNAVSSLTSAIAIEPGGTQTVTSGNYTVANSTFSLTAKADAQNVVTELDENNNTVATNIIQPVVPGPDLLITDLKIVETDWTVGNKIHFQTTIKNNGTLLMPARAVKVTFNVNGVKSDSSSTNGAAIDIGASQTISSVGFTATAPSFSLTANVDYGKVIAETDENNNTGNLNIYLPKYKIVSSAGANGSISPRDSVLVSRGMSQVFTITPAGGYVVDFITVDGVNVAASALYTFVNVRTPHSISASFKPGTDINLSLSSTSTATADASNSSYLPIKAKDNNTTTYWSAPNASANHWLKIDMSSPKTIDSVRTIFKTAIVWKYKIEVSTDNTVWNMVANKTTNTTSLSTVKNVLLGTTCRYARITVTGSGTTVPSIKEFMVWGR